MQNTIGLAAAGRLQLMSYILGVLRTSPFAGCLKMLRCKASEILWSEAYRPVRRNDEG
jgi:hypothetical protein